MPSSWKNPQSKPKLYLTSMARIPDTNQKVYYSNQIQALIRKQENAIQKLKKQLDRYESFQAMVFEQVLRKPEKENPVASLLNRLPGNYPISSIFINGKQQRVTRFLSMNGTGKMVLFLDGDKIKAFDMNSIDGIIWA